MMVMNNDSFFDYFLRLPSLAAYVAYDKATALYFNWSQIFNGWGIHLFVGKFGAGKTSLMVAEKLMNSVANILSFIS